MENDMMKAMVLQRHPLQGEVKYHITIRNMLRTIDDTSSMKVQVPCTVSMTSVGQDNDVYQVTFGDLLINGHGDGEYDQWEWLYAKIFSMNNLLVVKTDTTGKLIRVGERAEIMARWQEARADILVTFSEEEANAIVDTLDKEFASNLKQLYLNDTLLNFLFNDLFHHYNGQTVSTPKTLLKHFGPVEVPIIEYKTLTDNNIGNNTATIKVTAKIEAGKLDIAAVNDYLAQVNHMEAEEDTGYTFGYDGFYILDTDAAHGYIKEADLKISGSFGEYFEKIGHYQIKLQEHE